MENSPTGESTVAPASNEPTGQAPVDNTAEQNQDTISQEQSQEAVSDDTANQTQTQETGGGNTDEDGLAKFAKSQGFDPENLSDGERRALKIAHDNQKAFRQSSGQKVSETAKTLGTGDVEARIANLEYERTTEQFFSNGRDREYEPMMAKILMDKAKELTPTLGEAEARKYAYNLSRDLPTLYDLARLQSGAGSTVDADAIRREERESIKRQSTASAGQAHAVTQNTSAGTKITREWLSTHYQPSNPEHRKLVDEAVANGDL